MNPRSIQKEILRAITTEGRRPTGIHGARGSQSCASNRSLKVAFQERGNKSRLPTGTKPYPYLRSAASGGCRVRRLSSRPVRGQPGGHPGGHPGGQPGGHPGGRRGGHGALIYTHTVASRLKRHSASLTPATKLELSSYKSGTLQTSSTLRSAAAGWRQRRSARGAVGASLAAQLGFEKRAAQGSFTTECAYAYVQVSQTLQQRSGEWVSQEAVRLLLLPFDAQMPSRCGTL